MFRIIPQVCEAFLTERQKYDDQLLKLEAGTEEYENIKAKRDVMKFLTNAVYGYLAYRGSRMFDVDVASTVTALAREGIMKVLEFFEQLGYRPLYCDTDSVFVQMPFDKATAVVSQVNKMLEKYLTEKYGIKKCNIKLKFEKYSSKVLFLGVKKRYAMKVVWEGSECNYVKVVGFEAKRTDQSEFTRKLQNDVLNMLLNGQSLHEIVSYVRESVKGYRERSLDEISIPKGIDKPLHEYKSKPPHVKGALLANAYLGARFGVGSKVKMLYVKHVPGLPRTDVICFETPKQLPEGVEVDWDRMIEVSVKQKLEDILEAVGIGWSNILGSENLDRWL
ncbi:MAG: DNA polymerase domain-containing protein [Candidatus Jordarchaeales archaeon]